MGDNSRKLIFFLFDYSKSWHHLRFNRFSGLGTWHIMRGKILARIFGWLKSELKKYLK